jgi:hypothetical protein
VARRPLGRTAERGSAWSAGAAVAGVVDTGRRLLLVDEQERR